MTKRIVSVLVLMLAAGGCSQVPLVRQPEVKPVGPSSANTEQIQLRANAASLLFDLIEDEKNVSKIFVIKSGNQEVKGLIQLISATALAHEQELNHLAQLDPELNFKALGLPPGEMAARKAEAKSEEYDLLFSSGANFEFNLLLTQAQAENYGSHLAKVAAKNATLPEEIKTFTGMSEAMQHLYEDTVKQMRSLPPEK